MKRTLVGGDGMCIIKSHVRAITGSPGRDGSWEMLIRK